MGGPADQSSDDLLGQVVGKYRVVRLIGAGGMGRVYEGQHAVIGKRVALKFIDRESVTTEAVLRFQREAQAASAVESAHIVEIYDVGATDDGRPYLVMELLRGEDLGHRIRRLGRLEVHEALKIAAQVLRGLARAHEAGIVHRDLKPDNVFLVERDDDPAFAKVLDFGISKIQRPDGLGSTTITREGVVLGTPVYMSPEQAQALPDVDARTDIWSTGAILHECLTGRPPHSGPSYEAVIVAICTKDVDDVRLHNPAVSPELADVIKRALDRDRARRFPSAREMLDALVAASDGLLTPSLRTDSQQRAVVRPTSHAPGSATLAAVSTMAATPVGSGATTSLPARRWVAFGAAFVALGGLGAGVAMLGMGPAPERPAGNALQPSLGLTGAPVTASAPPAAAAESAIAVSPVAAASATGSSSSTPAATARALAVGATAEPSPRPVKPVMKVEAKPGAGGIGDGLQLKEH